MQEDDIKKIQQAIERIEERNRRVEADKAWETSWSRKGTIIILTYFVFVLFMSVARIGHPWINAIVPSIGFFLSTLTLPLVKRWWLKQPR